MKKVKSDVIFILSHLFLIFSFEKISTMIKRPERKPMLIVRDADKRFQGEKEKRLAQTNWSDLQFDRVVKT
jgi:hypothetical protein